jgi:predicted nucleotidyltransferase
MSNIYKADLNKIRQESLSDVFIHLEEQLSKLDINFYLIGAVARDLWVSGIYDIALGRITLDLDLAVLIEDHSQYELLKENLIKTSRFLCGKSQ